jgi:perosamine synthetase
VNPRILYTKPSITSLETRYAADAAQNGWGEKCYEYITRFEENFSRYLGVKHAVATSSCTGALHLGFASLGIGPGDEIILADTNWIATAAPIVHLGATPVFVDILPDTWCIDPEQVEKAVTNKTKAIVATHLYGNLSDMQALQSISEKYGITLVEDAAEAIGSVWHDKRAGSIGAWGAFSFHGTKTITTGEGGMFVTNNTALFEKVVALNNHGRSKTQSKQFWADETGYKFKMSNIQAAIGCAQLERVEELTQRKRSILKAYADGLADIEGLTINPELEGTVIGSWMPNIVFSPKTNITREMLIATFASANIDARVFFWPLSSLPQFNPVRDNVNAWSIPARAINLPSYHDMSDAMINRVIATVKLCLKTNG